MITTDLHESLQTNNLVLADFWTPGCGYCKFMLPAVNNLAQAYPDLTVCKVNMEEQAEFRERFQLKALPTFILFKNGQPVNRLEGMQPFQVLEGLVKGAA